jgi:hypothetical protein
MTLFSTSSTKKVGSTSPIRVIFNFNQGCTCLPLDKKVLPDYSEAADDRRHGK